MFQLIELILKERPRLFEQLLNMLNEASQRNAEISLARAQVTGSGPPPGKVIWRPKTKREPDRREVISYVV